MKNTILKLSFGSICVLLLSLLFVSQAAAQMGKLERCVLQDGSEVYLARDAAKKDLTGFDCKMRQSIGFVYLEQTNSTVPIYSLRKISNGKAMYRIVTLNDQFQSLQSSGWMAYPGDGIIGYASLNKVPGTLGVYGFTQTNVKGDEKRYRVDGKEFDTWNAIKGVSFDSLPAFWIWKEQKFGAGVEMFKQLQDITFRPTIYAMGKKNSAPIDFSVKYGTPNKPLTLNCSDAVSTSDNYCQFNIGVLLTRTRTDTEQTFHVVIDGGSNPSSTPIGNSGVFLMGANTAEIVIPAYIKKYKSTVTVRLGDLPPDQDKSRDNNTFKVQTFVSPTK